MNSSNFINLCALAIALPQVEFFLPKELHEQIRRLGEALKNQQPEVDRDICTIAQQEPHLKDRYEAAYQELQSQYESQNLKSTPEEPFAWADLAVPILTAEDFTTAAKNLLKQTKPFSRHRSNEKRVFLTYLEKAVITHNSQEITILRAIDQQLLTVEDLAYYVKMPFEQVQAIVHHLWNEGYIALAPRRLPYTASSLFETKAASHPSVDRTMIFNLTPKGHFYLHPLTRRDPQQGGIA